MFKAFRIRLITLTMLSITAIVFAIIGAINISNIVRLRMHADSMLNFISDHNGTIPENSTEIELLCEQRNTVSNALFRHTSER